jgi:hypothetical protein
MGRKAIFRTAVALLIVAIVVGVAASVYVATDNGGKGANGGQGSTTGPGGKNYPAQFLTVSGNQLLNSQGKPARLIGVNIGASQYYCLGKHTDPFPMPIDSASVTALLSWHLNAVRLLVDEYCWLGIDGEPDDTSSATYRADIESFVSLLNAAHIEVILTMTDASGSVAKSENGGKKQTASQRMDPMAQLATAPPFWTSVASTFKNTPGVIFDLFGEPQKITWPCWEYGCTISGIKLVGMQQLVSTVRATGARQPLILEGLDYANNLAGWLSHEPNDPDHQLVASVAVYQQDPCVTGKCWNATVAKTQKRVPVVTTELGDSTCSTRFIAKYMKWADKHSLSYIAWGWSTGGGCAGGGTLLANYSGTPTAYGTEFKDHVAQLYQSQTGATDLSFDRPLP